MQFPVGNESKESRKGCGQLTVVPWWPEGVILHTPARREDHKVSNRHTWFGTWASQDSVDGGVLSGELAGGRGFIGVTIDMEGAGVHGAAIDMGGGG